jgi:hypothetical protein
MAVDILVYCCFRKLFFVGNPPIFFSFRNIKIILLVWSLCACSVGKDVGGSHHGLILRYCSTISQDGQKYHKTPQAGL